MRKEIFKNNKLKQECSTTL